MTDINGWKVWASAANLPARKLVKSPVDLIKQMAKKPKRGVRIGKWFWQGSFVAPFNKGKGVGVFVRKGGARLPIKQVSVDMQPFIEQSFDDVRPVVAGELAKKMAQEINFILNVEK